jgi:hypothetical protein
MTFRLNPIAMVMGIAIVLGASGCGGGGGGAATSAASEGTTTKPLTIPAAADPNVVVSSAIAVLNTNAAVAPTSATTGEQRTQLLDTCFLDNGQTKAYRASTFEADKAIAIASSAFDVGSTRSNQALIAERITTNPDGSTRREIDLSYDIAYTDGSSLIGAITTLIAGSSSGTPGCTTGQASADFRVLGNQKLVGTSIRAENIRIEQAKMIDGTDFPSTGNSSILRRQVVFAISDPLGNAKYAVVTGPGVSTSVGGVSESFSLKMISARLLRDDPLLQGKPRNVVNFKDTDIYQPCRNTTGSATSIRASTADCAANGANSADLGVSLTLSSASGVLAPADLQFDALQFVAGGTYTFAIYNDDGWKTVDGQAGKTPIATYTTVMQNLPYTFAEMGAGLPAVDKHPQFSAGFGSLASNAHLAVSSTVATAASVSWALPVGPYSDAKVFRVGGFGEVFQGPQTCTQASAFPRLRFSTSYYPSSAAATNNSGEIAVSATPASICRKTYAEFGVLYTDRRDRRLAFVYNWQ